MINLAQELGKDDMAPHYYLRTILGTLIRKFFKKYLIEIENLATKVQDNHTKKFSSNV